MKFVLNRLPKYVDCLVMYFHDQNIKSLLQIIVIMTCVLTVHRQVSDSASIQQLFKEESSYKNLCYNTFLFPRLVLL